MATFPLTGLHRVVREPQRYRRPCPYSGKVRWVDEVDAQEIVRRLGNVGAAYRCPRGCGGWHITRRR